MTLVPPAASRRTHRRVQAKRQFLVEATPVLEPKIDFSLRSKDGIWMIVMSNE
jgi:hypothetical protein